MIRAVNIRKTYHIGDLDVEVLKGVSFEVKRGEFVAITGPSGSGKSTLLHILGLLDRHDSGQYLLAGQEVSGLSEEELACFRNDKIGFIFQMFNLLPRLKARENVSLPLIYTPGESRNAYPSPEDLLGRLGLGSRIDHNPNKLSGGEQQRVAIARAILKNPELILADEPTGNLDSKTALEILGILKELNREGITIVMITHEESLALKTGRIIKIKDGNIVSDKPTSVPVSAAAVRVSRRAVIKRHKLNLLQMKSYFSQALKSLFSNKTRSVLSILGVMIGVMAVITMLALGTGARADIEERLSNLGSNILSVRTDRHATRSIAAEGGYVPRFTLEDSDAIRRLSLIKRVSPTVSGSVQVVYENRNRNTSIIGVSADYEQMRMYTPVRGTFFTEEQNLSRKRVALIGKTVSEDLFQDADPIGKTLKINRTGFRVIGVLPEKGSGGWRDNDDLVMIPINTAMYRVMGKKYVDQIDVEIENEDDVTLSQTAIKMLISSRHKIPEDRSDMVDVRNWAELQEAASATAKTFSWLLGSIALISLLVGGIGIMNIMLVTVTERTREIGLRKAIGADGRDILAQFIIEALVVCLLGGISGIALGSFASFGLAYFAGWRTKISLGSVLLSFMFSAFIGVFFGLWPARKASKLSPIEALRYE